MTLTFSSRREGSLVRLGVLALLLSLVTLSCEALAAGKQEITLDLLYGKESLTRPMPSALTWIPDGSGLLFLETIEEEKTEPANDAAVKDEDEEGDDEEETPKRRLVRIDASTGDRRVLLDDQEMEDLVKDARHAQERASGRAGFTGFQVSNDGTSLLLSRDGDLYLVDVTARSARRLTATKSKERHGLFSPDGRKISFSRDHDVFVIDLDRGLEVQLTQGGTEDLTWGESDWVYDEELDLHGGTFWSPDATRLALLRFDESPVPRIPLVDNAPTHPEVTWQRYPKAGDPNPIVSVWVVEVTGEKDPVRLQLPEDGEHYVARVGFLPDGSKALVHVLDRAQTTLRIFRCDPASGEAALLFEEKSPYWIDGHDDYRFLEKGGLVWTSGKSGFRHLSLHGADGKLVRALTSGPWMVDGIAGIDESKGTVYFTATKDTVLERHLYAVDLRGGDPRRITALGEDHSINMARGGTCYVDSHSSAIRPPVMDVYRATGEKLVSLGDSSKPLLDELAVREPEFLVVPGEGGKELPAYVVKPVDFDPQRRYPVLFYVYGGPLSQTVRNRWSGTRGLWHQMLANRGIVVFSIDNRASFGMGLESASVIRGNLGHHELEDLRHGARYLARQSWVDPDRLAVWGWSYGGTMAGYSILNGSDVFKVAVSVAPVTDWRNYDTIYTERYMGTPQDNEEGYASSSLVKAASKLEGKLLLSHGTADDNVHFQNALQLVKALTDAGKNFDFMAYPGGRHGIGGKKIQKQMFTAITAFLEEHLLTGNQDPSPGLHSSASGVATPSQRLSTVER